MRQLRSFVAVLTTTLALLALCFSFRPFDAASEALDHAFHATPAWTQVTDLVHDPRTQELTHGEAPRVSLDGLAAAWAGAPTVKKVIIIGNSQTMAVSLAPGEEPPTGPEPTWTDLAAAHFAAAADLAQRALVYRLSAPGSSYPEALFYVEYLAEVPALRPDVLVIQLNYQSFWNGGIRDGMFELLDNPAFRAGVEREIRSGAPYADAFATALHEHDARAKPIDDAGGPADTTSDPGFGLAAERTARRWLDGIPDFRSRHLQKEDLADLLYRMRIYLLRLSPTTARSIAGTRFVQARASIQAILAFCRAKNIQPVLYLAPVNPQLNLYRTAEDRARFDGLVAELEAAGTPVAHLENAIPGELWGRQFDGPDPLHLGRRGHQELASRLIPLIAAALHGVQ